MLRTHTCGELASESIGANAVLCGWVQVRRDHGGVIFIDLRDRYGITQVVFDPSQSEQCHKAAEHIGREWVLRVSGTVRARKEGMKNPNLKTGEIEIIAEKLDILSKAQIPPFEIEDKASLNDDLRLRYRYLDLRRTPMQRQLAIRHGAYQATREFLSSQGFLEIETPFLIRSTPEGARDYIVPSRVNLGKAYALPQSPQLYKQLLMVAGMDRYFQIVRCLRDEDLRSDRQPEFTQIDAEMSFAEEEDVFAILEGLVKSVFKRTIGVDIKTPFPRMSYDEAMERYGSDKPDIRYGLELKDVTGIVGDSDFTIFKKAIAAGSIAKCLVATVPLTRGEIDDLIAFTISLGAGGLAWMRVQDGKLESNIVKFFSAEIQERLLKETGAKDGDTLLFVADKEARANKYLAQLRSHIAQKADLVPKDSFSFLWVTRFPLFQYNEEEDRIEPAHHIFTRPVDDHLPLLESEPLKVRAHSYDLTLNGLEVTSGSIRNHDPEMQKRIFHVGNLSDAQIAERFGFFLDAFTYGAPPHGGFAVGFDRLVALMCGFSDIREVIAFPKNKKAENPMDGSPSNLEEAQLKELGLKLDFVKKDKE